MWSSRLRRWDLEEKKHDICQEAMAMMMMVMVVMVMVMVMMIMVVVIAMRF
jgi:hypothetical protein